MKYLLPALFILLLLSCKSEGFDSDERQIIAKNVIRRQLHKIHGFDILSFRQDTLASFTNTTIKHPLVYTLDIVYIDSTGDEQTQKGVVVFAPGSNTVLSSSINP